MADNWIVEKEWPELILERLEDTGVVRITLNRREKRNAPERAFG